MNPTKRNRPDWRCPEGQPRFSVMIHDVEGSRPGATLYREIEETDDWEKAKKSATKRFLDDDRTTYVYDRWDMEELYRCEASSPQESAVVPPSPVKRPVGNKRVVKEQARPTVKRKAGRPKKA